MSESVQLQKIKDIQAERPKVLTEIERLSKENCLGGCCSSAEDRRHQ